MRSLLILLVCLFRPRGAASAPLLESSLRYEYKDYSCEAQKGRAVLSVAAGYDAANNPLLALTSVMDISGSMQGEKLELAKETNIFLVDKLVSEPLPHKFGAVVFGSRARELFPLQELDAASAQAATATINATNVAGSTNLFDGIVLGIQQQMNDAGDAVRGVFVFTDGRPSSGETRPNVIVAKVRELVAAAEEKIAVYVFGFGADLDYDLLRSIAIAGNGVAYIIADEDDIPKSFGAALGGLLSTAALQLRLEVSPLGDAQLLKVSSGGDVQQTANGFDVKLDDLFMDERRDVFVEFQFSETCESKDGFAASQVYIDAASFQEVTTVVEAKRPERLLYEQADRKPINDVEEQAVRFEVSARLDDASTALGENSIPRCTAVLEQILAYLRDGGYTNFAYFATVEKDILTFLDVLAAARRVTIELRAELDGLRDAILKQRTGLVDDEKYGVVAATITGEMEKTGEEAIVQVLDADKWPFRVNMTHKIVSWFQGPDYDELEVALTLRTPTSAGKRPPLSITAVLDKSGSMAGRPYELLIKTQLQMIDFLAAQKETDVFLGTILFSSDIETLQELENIKDIDVERLKADLEASTASGFTYLGEALTLGVEQQLGHQTCQGSRTVFLFTDGTPSSGRYSIAPNLQTQLEKAAFPIQVYSFGLGDFDLPILQNISRVGAGELYIMLREEDIGTSFGDALGGLLSVAARNVSVSLKSPSGVEIVSVFPKAKEASPQSAKTGFIDMFDEEARDVLVQLRLEKDAPAPEILEIEVSYADVTECNVRTFGGILIPQPTPQNGPPTPEAQRRSIEVKIVGLLTPAMETCFDGDLTTVIADVTAALDVAEAVNNGTDEYLTDLETDLVTILGKLEKVRQGRLSRTETCMILEELVDLLATQRTKGTGEHTFRIEKYYSTPAKRDGQDFFNERVDGMPERPAIDVLSLTYPDMPDEIGSGRLNLTLDLDIRTIDAPTVQNPSAVVCLVDGTESVTAKELEVMKEVVLDIYQEFERSPLFEKSYLGIVVYAAVVSVPLRLTRFDQIDEIDIDEIFAAIQPTGDTKFMTAVEEGFVTLNYAPYGLDLIMIPFVSGALNATEAPVDAERFLDLEADLGFPLTCIPVIIGSYPVPEYFQAFPPYVQSSLIFKRQGDDTGVIFRQIRPALFSVAAKRVLLDIETNSNITISSVTGASEYKDGFYLDADLKYEEDRDLLVTVDVGAHDRAEVLFALKIFYYDMRSFYAWDLQAPPLVARRVDSQLLKQRQNVRVETTKVLLDAKEDVESGADEAALDVVSLQLAQIRVLDSKDTVVQEIYDDMLGLTKALYDLIAGKLTQQKILAQIEADLLKLDVTAVIGALPVEDEIENDEDSGPPVVPSRPREKLSLTAPEDVIVEVGEDTVVVPVEVKTPLSSGLLFEAGLTFVVDASAAANATVARKMLEALLTVASGRRGVRAVDIFAWNRRLKRVYQNLDFTQSDVSDAVAAVEGMRRGNDTTASVLVDAVEETRKLNFTVSALFCIATTSVTEADDPAVVFEDLQQLLNSGDDPLTIFSFGYRLSPDTIALLNNLAGMTGGELTILDDAGVGTKPELDIFVRDVARTTLGWIDKTFAKNVRVDCEARGSDGTEGETGGGDFPLVFASLAYSYRETFRCVLPLTTGAGSGRNETTVQLTTAYFNLREGKSVDAGKTAVSIDPVPPAELEALTLLNMLLDNLGVKIRESFGSNALDEAILYIVQCQILAFASSVVDRPEVQKTISRFSSMQGRVERFVKDRQDFVEMQDAFELLEDMGYGNNMAQDGHIALGTNTSLLSTSEGPAAFSPMLYYTTPTTPPAVSQPRVFTVVAVFDKVMYKPPLDLGVEFQSIQQALTVDILERLVTTGETVIELIAISTSEDSVQALPMYVVDQFSVNRVKEYLTNLAASGSPAGLYESLQTGLAALDDVTSESERFVWLFSAPSSSCRTSELGVDDILAPYLTFPVVPVKVLTFTVGLPEAVEEDTISALTGGKRFYISTLSESEEAVSESAELMAARLFRGMRLNLRPSRWMTRPITLGSVGHRIESFPQWTAAFTDALPGSVSSVGLTIDLDAWEGDAELFEYSFSYFSPSYQQWYTSPIKPARLYRAPKPVLAKRTAIYAVMTEALVKAEAAVAAADVEAAVAFVRSALLTIDASPYQDDTLILRYAGALIQVYDSLLEATTVTADLTVVRHRIAANRADFETDPVTTEDSDQENDLSLASLQIGLFTSVATILFLVAALLCRV